MAQKILVTGSTGNLGTDVVEELLVQGFEVKAGTRNPGNIHLKTNVEPVRVQFEEPETFKKALNDVYGIFLIAPPMDPKAPDKLIPLIDLAKETGVEHIIFTSAMGADKTEDNPLRKIEKHLINSGVNYTILRPNFFMENFSKGFLAPMINERKGLFLTAGNGKTSFVSTKDIAKVAAQSFKNKDFGSEYDLTGSEAYSHREVADMISEATGKEVMYNDLTDDELREAARQQGMPEDAIKYMAELYGAVRAGKSSQVTPFVKRVSGEDPVQFMDFIEENADMWK